ncbi:hypothetical protein Pcinc_028530 [Petrolisthes cinctipes]|uniref:Uncharacterized protein n=1 Tax=Petrolisthes cinctipes TaxID=88211 RepID=A0AAE1K597_PETCI|nr:hypothetical protein Pcinc_028530 [Petrolisthes cinctipes]
MEIGGRGKDEDKRTGERWKEEDWGKREIGGQGKKGDRRTGERRWEGDGGKMEIGGRGKREIGGRGKYGKRRTREKEDRRTGEKGDRRTDGGKKVGGGRGKVGEKEEGGRHLLSLRCIWDESESGWLHDQAELLYLACLIRTVASCVFISREGIVLTGRGVISIIVMWCLRWLWCGVWGVVFVVCCGVVFVVVVVW